MLIIVGSRREGNSYHLANRIKDSLEKDRIHTDIITPGNQKIHICTGCMDCDKSGVCDFTDDMKSNIDKIKNEDILLFITPTRWNLLSGDLKIFIDRLNPLYSTSGLKGKKGLIASIGSKGKDLYSTESSTTSLRSFMESAKMDCVLTHDFNDCLLPDDILSHTDEIDAFIEEVKKICNAN